MGQPTATQQLAGRVRRLRTRRGWSAQALADACAGAGGASLTRGTIAKIESGVRQSVTVEETAVLARVLGVSPTDLLAPPSAAELLLEELLRLRERSGHPDLRSLSEATGIREAVLHRYFLGDAQLDRAVLERLVTVLGGDVDRFLEPSEEQPSTGCYQPSPPVRPDSESFSGSETFWGLLGPAERKAIRERSTIAEYTVGTVIWSEGDRSHRVVVISKGRVRVSAGGLVLAVRGPGEVLGELSAVDGRPNSSYLTAIDHVVVMEMTAESFRQVIEQMPRVTRALLHVLVTRQRAVESALPVPKSAVLRRVATVLLDASTGGAEAGVALSQRELAQIVGVSRETLARALRVLKDNGIVETSRNRILVREREGLISLASPGHD